jgi:hypothetical protein
MTGHPQAGPTETLTIIGAARLRDVLAWLLVHCVSFEVECCDPFEIDPPPLSVDRDWLLTVDAATAATLWQVFDHTLTLGGPA